MNPQNRAVIPKQQQQKQQISNVSSRQMIWQPVNKQLRQNIQNAKQTRMVNSSPKRMSELVEEAEEYFGNVTIANQPNFETTAYALNPGNTTLFPRMAQLAKLYEKYAFDYVRIKFQPAVSEFNAIGTAGTVMLHFDNDAADGPPTSTQQILSTEPHMSNLPCRSMIMEIPKPMLNSRVDGFFIRPGGLPGQGDIKTYDVGNINVATESVTTNGVAGKLFIQYKVRMFNKVLDSTTSAPKNNSVSQFYGVGQGLATNVSETLTFSGVTVASGYSNGLQIVNTAGSFVPPSGNYLVSCDVQSETTGNSTEHQVEFKKNGSDVFASNVICFRSFPSGANPEVPLSFAAYITANGTDAFTIVARQVFSTGAGSADATLRWLAV